MQHFGNLRDGRAVNGNIKRCNNATLPIVPAIICGLTKACHRVAIAIELDNARVLSKLTNALTFNVGNGFAISANVPGAHYAVCTIVTMYRDIGIRVCLY